MAHFDVGWPGIVGLGCLSIAAVGHGAGLTSTVDFVFHLTAGSVAATAAGLTFLYVLAIGQYDVVETTVSADSRIRVAYETSSTFDSHFRRFRVTAPGAETFLCEGPGGYLRARFVDDDTVLISGRRGDDGPADMSRAARYTIDPATLRVERITVVAGPWGC